MVSLLEAPAFVSSYCEKERTLWVKLEQKYLLNTKENSVRVTVMSSKPDINSWVYQIQCQISHWFLFFIFIIKISKKLSIKFYNLYMFIFLISNHKLGTCSLIKKKFKFIYFIFCVWVFGLIHVCLAPTEFRRKCQIPRYWS